MKRSWGGWSGFLVRSLVAGLFWGCLSGWPFSVAGVRGSEGPRGRGASRDSSEGSALWIATGEAGQVVPAPAVSTDVYMWVSGVVLRAQVTQEFQNPTDQWIEGIYVFPLPETAAVDHLRMKIGARIIEGEIHEREEARRVYEEAKDSGRKASLVSQKRPNVFSTHVANIGPGESIEVTIEYQETVHYDAGEFRMRFPSVVAPRYAGAIGDSAPETRAVETADEPDDEPPVDLCDLGGNNTLDLAVELDPGFPLKFLYSPSHVIGAVPLDGTAQLVRLSEPVPADRDFVLVWAPAVGREPGAALFTEQLGGETFALLVLMPPDAPNAGNASPSRETVFVLDTSGSMFGDSLEQAKLALHLALDNLRPEDSFDVIEFNSTTRRLFPRSVAAAPDNVAEAYGFVDSLVATGGTEMRPALEAALEDEADLDTVRQVVFVTDGAVSNEADLFAFIESHLGRTRLFTVGIGSAPNTYFMRKAARFGRGTYTYIGSVDEVSERMDALFRKIERPALTDVEVAWSDPDAEQWPVMIQDLYAGEPIVVSARLSANDGALLVSGNRASTSWEDVLDASAVSRSAEGIATLWARRKIDSLEDSLVEGANREQVRAEITELGLAHHLVTAYTSLVAVDVTPTAPAGSAVQSRIALNAPFGSGVLPQTATPARLYALLAVVLAASALALRVFRREVRCA